MTYDQDRAMSQAEQAYLTEPEGDDHYPSCPAHQDAEPICDCGCLESEHNAAIPFACLLCDREDCAEFDESDQDCGCAEIDTNEAAGRADAKNDEERE